jgi:hypothetical protein
MKISNHNSFGFIVANHPVIKVSPPQAISSPPPRVVPVPKKDAKKKS